MCAGYLGVFVRVCFVVMREWGERARESGGVKRQKHMDRCDGMIPPTHQHTHTAPPQPTNADDSLPRRASPGVRVFNSIPRGTLDFSPCFQAQQQFERLYAIVPAIDKVAHEHVVRVGDFSARPEQLEEVKELPVDVAADRHGACHGLDVRLLHQEILHLRRTGDKETMTKSV